MKRRPPPVALAIAGPAYARRPVLAEDFSRLITRRPALLIVRGVVRLLH